MTRITSGVILAAMMLVKSILKLSARAAKVALGADTHQLEVLHLLSTSFNIIIFYYTISIQGASLDTFTASVKEIFYISEFSILRAILEPTEVIRDEMPEGET
jgi:hypothetical protein